MADQALRELERTWRRTGADDDWTRLVAAARRLAGREQLRVELMAGEPRFMDMFLRRAPARVRNALELAIPTESLRYLLAIDGRDLLSRLYFGPKSLQQLQDMLAEYDLRLAMSQDDVSAVLGPLVLTPEQQAKRRELINYVVEAAVVELYGGANGRRLARSGRLTSLRDVLSDKCVTLFAEGRRRALQDYGLFLPMSLQDADAYIAAAGYVRPISRVLQTWDETD